MIKIRKGKRIKKTRKKKKVKKKAGKKKAKVNVVKIPAKLLVPVSKFLKANLKKLERRKKELEEEDPFEDPSRVTDNASPDTDAAEQFGHARITAIKEQLDRKIIQTRKALSRIKVGKYGICEDCGEMIDTDRLMVYPEATLCANCKAKREK
ncbi:MAG: TraR/DksA family transcriptional regulator [Candidatus Woesebacteria bacterium]|jgi:DnaK suppressor protein